jgi:hypothetical protein
MWPFTVNCESCRESIWRWSKRCTSCGAVRGAGKLKEDGIVAPPPLEKDACPSCKKPVGKGSNFCAHCGLGSASGTRKCADTSCGARSPGDARYCATCGRPFADAEKPALRGETVWARTKDDLMARVEVRDCEGWFRRGLVVEFGTEALFLLDGRFACVLEPGRHDLGGMIKRGIDLRARYEATAVVYDSSEFSLSFGEIKALTKENVEIHAQCELRLRVEDAAKLFTNVAKGADVLRRVDLMLFLAPEVANGLGEAIRPHGVQVFRESYSMKRDLEQALMNHLSRTLEHTGLGVGYLRVFNVRQERLDAQNRKIAEYFFQATDMTVESDGRRQLLGARQDLLGVERAEVAQQADHLRQSLEPRLAFLSATRNLQAADWENENLMAELRRQYDRAGFARELSFEQFQQEARLNSVQALRTLQERLDQDYRKLTKINEVEMVRLTGDVSVARIEQEQRGINTQFDAELGRQGRGADFNRTQRQLEVDTDLGIKRKEFDANTDMRRVEVDTLRQEAALSMDNLERLKAIERNDQLALQGGLVDLRLREQKARVELEIQTFQALKDMPQETILAIKSPEHLAQVLQKRAGADVAERFYALQAEQQTAFVAHMQQMMSAAMAQNAKVAETAAQRPASVVFGPAFSSPATIQPPVVQPTIVQPPDQNAS